MEFTENDLKTLNKEIELLNLKLEELQQKRALIENQLLTKKRLKANEERYQRKLNDISKDEFFTKIKQLFHQSLNVSSNDVEEQRYNKLILLIIERSIIIPLFNEEKYSEKPRTKQIFETVMTDLVYNRFFATEKLSYSLCGGGYGGRDVTFDAETYNDIIEVLVNKPEAIGNTYGIITKDDKDVFDYKTAKQLYNELLIPYYKSLDFPTKNGMPYVFNLADFESFDPIDSRISEVTKYYMEEGVPLSIIQKMLRKPYITLEYSVCTAPKEVMLMEQYKEEISKGNFKR